MTWDQPDLWGVKPTPAADTYRMTTPLKTEEWFTCWNDCALCDRQLHKQTGVGRAYQIYRICTAPGRGEHRCFESSPVCEHSHPHACGPDPGWEDY